MTSAAFGRPVAVAENVTPQRFREEILPGNEPVLLKGLVAVWPSVREAANSAGSAVRYLKRFDRGKPVETLIGQPEIGGRFFYNDQLDGLNFTWRSRTMLDLYVFGQYGDPLAHLPPQAGLHPSGNGEDAPCD